MTPDDQGPAIAPPQLLGLRTGSHRLPQTDVCRDVQRGRIKLGQDPARRPVFLKLHGVAHGRFEVRPDFPENLKIGVFAMSSFPAWVRFASDTLPVNPDLKTTLGIGIKLFGVPGDKLLGDGDTHDFVLQNFDIFFVNTAKDMCEFTRAGVVEGSYKPYLESHPVTSQILKDMKKAEASLLTTTYWSVVPYVLGDQQFVKYKLEPETAPDSVPFDDPDYLALDMAQRLLAGEARFKFMVQLRTDPAAMLLDKATVRWEESQSQPIHVATLILPRQDINMRGQAAYGENLAFNAWHCLQAHAPQGSISEARKIVYAASADERRNENGVPLREPGPPRPHVAVPRTLDPCIVKAAIHPSIGIARVGNSQEGRKHAWHSLRQAQTSERRAECSATDVRHNDQFQHGSVRKFNLVFLDLAYCLGRAEVPLLAHNFSKRAPAIRRPS